VKPRASTVLKRLGACPPALAWCRAYERAHPTATLAQMWAACRSGAWMYWLAEALHFRFALEGLVFGTVNQAYWSRENTPKDARIRAAVRKARAWPAIRAAFERAGRAAE
jgi:hypothetical protein